MKKRKPAVGVIGLGIMGGAMAQALAAAGHDVFGYDPAPAARRRLERAGGYALESSFAVANRARILITSLPSSPALSSTVRQVGQARASPNSRRILVEMSTLPIADKRRAQTELARAGWTALDCPISGTAARLKDRDWMIFASGGRRACASVRPLLRVFTDQIPYVGDFGSGMRMKLVANHLVAILNVASGEAITLARSMGLDARQVWALFASNPAVGNGVLRLRGRFMVERRYRPATMKVEIWQKDMRIIGEAARSAGAATPLFDACAPIYAAAMAQGFGSADTASVCEVLARRRRRRSRIAGQRTPPRGGKR
jgi:3-hydroxyisobutyrate dehydrogenase-like beta-hydroxyacid dehydrogenase